MEGRACDNHKKQYVEYYCIKEDTPFCTRCIKDHNGHKFMSLEKIGELLKEVYNAQSSEIGSTLEGMQDKREDLIKMKEKSEHFFKKERDRFMEISKELNKLIEEHMNKLAKKEEDVMKRCRNDSKDIMNRLEILINSKTKVEANLQEVEQGLREKKFYLILNHISDYLNQKMGSEA